MTKRYRAIHHESYIAFNEHPEGEWVRYEDTSIIRRVKYWWKRRQRLSRLQKRFSHAV